MLEELLVIGKGFKGIDVSFVIVDKLKIYIGKVDFR